MDLYQPPSVSIDGEAIRNIRETKRLTQLYISKVVGVTTDTVSRWENNRYPTIRKDNAIKLAEALEVDIDEILKHDDEVEEAIFESDDEQRKSRWPMLLLVVLIILGAAGLYWKKQATLPPIVLHAERLLPSYAAPGSWVLIRVKLTSEKTLKGMILREEFPKGWKMVESDPPASSLDNLQGTARWIFRNPGLKTFVSYRLEVPKNAVNGHEILLNGELIANPDGQRYSLPVQPVGSMIVSPLHWADTNGNHIIDDLEILEVSSMEGEIGQLHIDWDSLEKLWDAGGYRWDEKKQQFVPDRSRSHQSSTQETPDNKN